MNNALARKFLALAIGSSMLSASFQLHAQRIVAVCCPVPGTVIAFFNGVMNTERQAGATLKELKKIHGEYDQNRHRIQYKLMYNHTNGFEDFVETFEQRMRQQNEILAGRFELFFATLSGSGDGTWWTAINNTLGGPSKDLIASLGDTFRAAIIGKLLSLFRSPPTELNYAEHRAQINDFIAQGNKLLFVSHSQGNLFAVPAYDYAITQTRQSSVRVVHIGPASPTLRGQHILADLDLVINGLRPFGTVPSVTHLIPGYALRPPGANGHTDLLGHGMSEIYINQRLEIAQAVKNTINTALAELIPPNS